MYIFIHIGIADAAAADAAAIVHSLSAALLLLRIVGTAAAALSSYSLFSRISMDGFGTGFVVSLLYTHTTSSRPQRTQSPCGSNATWLVLNSNA